MMPTTHTGPTVGHSMWWGWGRAVVVLLAAGTLAGCASRDTATEGGLARDLAAAGPGVRSVLSAPADFRAQILISEPVTNRHGIVRLKRHGYRVDAEYFYPASAIKLCGAVAVLQNIELLGRVAGVPELIDVPLTIAPLFPGDAIQNSDPDNPTGGRITVGYELKKLALVSDNRAFNRMFDIVGHDELNRSMRALGLDSVVINHRLSDPRSLPSPYDSAAVTFEVPGRTPIPIPARKGRPMTGAPGAGTKVGKGYVAGGKTVDEPMDFSSKNRISLSDLQDLLVKVVRPDVVLPTSPVDLTPEHRSLLVDAMTRYPRESQSPRYSESDYPDHYAKFLLPGIRRVFPSATAGERIEVTGKIGRAYGFSVENACLTDPKSGRTVFVTATVYTNSDGVLNDDRYDYETVADPFFADLGEWVARRWFLPR